MPFHRFATMSKSHSSCCCFNIVNTAVIIGTLQLIQVALFTSNSGAIYDQWRTDPTLPNDPTVGTVGKAYLQILLANTIAYQIVWLACLFLFALAFQFWRAILVIPNLVMQVFSMLLGLLLIGALSQAINEVSGNTQNTSDGQKTRMVFFTSALVFVVVMWLVEFLILVVLIKFYIYLKEQDNKVIGSPFGHSAPTNGSRRVLERLETSELP